MAPRLRSWLRAVFRRPALNQEMTDELRLHADLYAVDLARKGVPPEEAARRARAELGGFDGRREAMRQALGLRLIDELRADVTYALRTLRRAPTFTIVAILTIALGIGANAAIFSLMEAAMWKPLPVRDPQRLRVFGWVSGPNDVMNTVSGTLIVTPDGERVETPISYPVYTALRANNGGVLDDLCAFKLVRRLTGVIDGQAELVSVELVSGNFYRMLGITPALGRPLLDSDDAASAPAVGVISHGYWSRRFGRDPSIIGKRIEINQFPITIVGVNPREFVGATVGGNAGVFLPIAVQPAVAPYRSGSTPTILDKPGAWWFSVMGRLKPGVTDQGALAALEVSFRQAVVATLPDRLNLDQPRLRLLDGSRGVDELQQRLGSTARVLLAVVGMVLLLACANLANLLLARAGYRGREISLRLALGAGRGRIVKQVLTEGLVLATLGGAAGLLLGFWARNAIPSFLGTSAVFGARVVLAGIGLTLVTGLLFSLAPAWQATRTPAAAGLKDAGRSTHRSRALGGRAFIVLQVALSAVILAGAGLFVRTLANLNRADLGFQPDQIVLFGVAVPPARYKPAELSGLFQRIEAGIRAIPGVQSVGLSTSPLVGRDTSTTSVGPDGREPTRGDADRSWSNDVGHEFFLTMSIPIVRGRGFDLQDTLNSPPVAVVNRQFVQKFFPTGEVLGRTVRNDGVLYRIVGVVGDARFRDIRTPPPPTFYRPHRQLTGVGGMFAVKSAAGEATLLTAVRDSVRAVDPQLPVIDFRSQRAQIESTLGQERLLATLTSTFGVLAIVLTCIGIYGVVASAVARRTSEIGVRMALGARRGQVLLLMLRESAVPVAIGLALGAAGVGLVTRYIASLLYEVRPLDPVSLVTSLVLVLTTALAASLIPARRATRLSPTVALRQE